ncbi:hypothetical protein ACLOJK_016820 [Asimina triloba]
MAGGDGTVLLTCEPLRRVKLERGCEFLTFHFSDEMALLCGCAARFVNFKRARVAKKAQKPGIAAPASVIPAMDAEEASWKPSSSSAPALGPAPPPPPPPSPPPLPPSSSKLATAPTSQRQRFYVELRPDQTTIVSWKRLLKESNKASKPPPEAPGPPCVAHPALESRIAPAGPLVDGERKDALPPPNRFSAVIEKIERLYMGQHSSDEEELDNVPDDDEYDTDDSFIDDTELESRLAEQSHSGKLFEVDISGKKHGSLDEYFEVDKSTTKHNGYFVNRGKLERINEHTSADRAPKKRRKKDTTKDQNQVDGKSLPNVKIGNMHAKAAAKSETLMGSKLSNSKISLSSSKNCQGVKSDNQLNAPLRSFSKKSTDSTAKSMNPSVEAPSKDVFAFSPEAKHLELQRANVVESRNLSNKLKATGEFDEGISIQNDHCSRQESIYSKERNSSSKIQKREKNGSHINASETRNPAQVVVPKKPQFTSTKERPGLKPKGAMLEQAIQELEKIVAASRPPTFEVQEVDGSSQGVKRRLLLDVKQKLAKVAQLAQSIHGQIPEELTKRLMGIVGHVMQLKTLKEARQQVGSSDDFQDMPHASDGIGKYSMDDAVENKLCDLYDLYVEGVEEGKSLEIKKLYSELAELWPSGEMDKYGVKKAIRRAKVRKSIRDSQLKEENVGRKKISAVAKTNYTRQGEARVHPQPATSQERADHDSSKTSLLAKKPVFKSVSTTVTSNLDLPKSGWLSQPSSNPSNLDQPCQEKVRLSANMVDEGSTARRTDVAVVRKKSKRKPESDLEEGHARPFNLLSPSQNGEERCKSKLAVSRPHKSSHPPAILQGFEQPN